MSAARRRHSEQNTGGDDASVRFGRSGSGFARHDVERSRSEVQHSESDIECRNGDSDIREPQLYRESRRTFAKRSVNVNFIQATPTTLASAVASGQADIGMHAPSVSLSIINSGKKTKIILATTGCGQGGRVFGALGVPSIESLKGKSDCKIGTLTAGSSAAGFAVLQKQSLGLTCEIVPFQDVSSQIGALVTKRVDVLVGAYPNFIRTANEEKATMLGVSALLPLQSASRM